MTNNIMVLTQEYVHLTRERKRIDERLKKLEREIVKQGAGSYNIGNSVVSVAPKTTRGKYDYKSLVVDNCKGLDIDWQQYAKYSYIDIWKDYKRGLPDRSLYYEEAKTGSLVVKVFT